MRPLCPKRMEELHSAQKYYAKVLKIEDIPLIISIRNLWFKDPVGLHILSGDTHLVLLASKLYSFWWKLVNLFIVPDPLQILAHEMIHAQQVSSRRLVVSEAHTMWENKVYRDKWLFAYWRRPWEVEARQGEKKLYKMWKQQKKKELK